MDNRVDKPDVLPLFKHYHSWQLIKAYWQSAEKVSATFFAIVIVGMTIALVGFDVVFNYWYNYFYDSLQAYNKHATVRLLIVFFILATFYIILAVYRYYISQIFGLRWRRWLTQTFLERWLRNRSYYYLENFDEHTDNPDQRIQEDILGLVTSSITLTTGLISSVTTFIAFIYILWSLSGRLTIPLGPLGSIVIPGYLVWVGVFYAAIGTWITFKVGKPLVQLNFEQQRREATFRFAAIDLRSHSENIALYQGETHQKSVLFRLFQRVLDNYYLLILRQKLLLWFTSGYNQASVVLPLIVALPNYFNKVFLLGGLIQSIQAFSRVQDSLSFIVNAYPQIAEWQAINQRLTTFINHATDMNQTIQQHKTLIIQKSTTVSNIEIKNLSITTPKNEVLLTNINLTFQHGKNYLLKGRSGIGKSSFVKVIAGIWPFAEGEVILPAQQNIMYLSQKPYMPIGTLREAVLFPDHEEENPDVDLVAILKMCHLEKFTDRLDETATWSEQLSPGEQQRVAFVRVLLHKPDWVFMDESTSMLDMKNETHLYNVLKTTLPNCSIVSIGHRASLDSIHHEIIDTEQFAFINV